MPASRRWFRDRRWRAALRGRVRSGAWGFIQYRATLPEKRSGRHRHVARLRAHAAEPGAGRGIAAEVEAGDAGAVRIGVEGDVGRAVAARGEERLALEVALHHGKRLVAALEQP